VATRTDIKSESPAAVVARQYRPDPNSCDNALRLLLEDSVRNKAAGPAPEPNGRDGTKVQGDSADAISIP
jgi:hypothetical protein